MNSYVRPLCLYQKERFNPPLKGGGLGEVYSLIHVNVNYTDV